MLAAEAAAALLLLLLLLEVVGVAAELMPGHLQGPIADAFADLGNGRAFSAYQQFSQALHEHRAAHNADGSRFNAELGQLYLGMGQALVHLDEFKRAVTEFEALLHLEIPDEAHEAALKGAALGGYSIALTKSGRFSHVCSVGPNELLFSATVVAVACLRRSVVMCMPAFWWYRRCWEARLFTPRAHSTTRAHCTTRVGFWQCGRPPTFGNLVCWLFAQPLPSPPTCPARLTRRSAWRGRCVQC
jgi:tetratricopeptide (TPR) repeat protein